MDPPAPPEEFEIVKEADVFQAAQLSASGEDFSGVWALGARFNGSGQIEIGVITGSSGIEWDKRIDFVVGTVVRCTASAAITEGRKVVVKKTKEEVKPARLFKQRVNNAASSRYVGEHNLGVASFYNRTVTNYFYTTNGRGIERTWNFANSSIWE